MTRHTNPIALIILFWLASVGCNSSPTVPVPPPQAVQTTIPDTDGFVTVSGSPDDRYGLDDIALVFNDNSGDGVMTDVENDGSFETRIRAQYHDLLLIQIKRMDKLSQSVSVTVGDTDQ
ncbi:MAG: hypothetical protein JXR76_28050 [Deltaproteobacteria bacterium]|nr:hypothetical protein [Deltaproteobacteria bacterium]